MKTFTRVSADTTGVQVECPAVTPEVVLKASGHVDKFDDLMVTDLVTGDCHRADHLLEHALEARLEDSVRKPTAEEATVRSFFISYRDLAPNLYVWTQIGSKLMQNKPSENCEGK